MNIDEYEIKKVKYQDGIKSVKIYKNIKGSFTLDHEGLTTTIDIPDDCELYYATRASSSFIPGKDKQNNVIGMVVGLVKNDEVIEERFLNGQQNIINGWRK